MTLYESIKRASIEEMGEYLYTVIAPFLDSLGFDEEEKQDARQKYLDVLKLEI